MICEAIDENEMCPSSERTFGLARAQGGLKNCATLRHEYMPECGTVIMKVFEFVAVATCTLLLLFLRGEEQ